MSGICFVASSRGNAFMLELLEGLAGAVREAGVHASISLDAFPDDASVDAFVVIPHEVFPLLDVDREPTPEQLRRTIGLCVEMPGTEWFEVTAECAPLVARTLAINTSSMIELRRRGLEAAHLQLGYWPAWDAWRGVADHPRTVDVAYLGSTDARRGRVLAGYADVLAQHRTKLLIPPLEPKTGPRPDFVIGAQKHQLLADTRLLVNLHRGESRSLEWVRVLEAMGNGCVVLTEHSTDELPLVAGEHMVVGAAESLGLLADHLLRQPERLAEIRDRAYDFVRTELPMSGTAATLLEVAGDLPVSASEMVTPISFPERPDLRPHPLVPSEPTEFDRLRAAVKNVAVHSVETKRLLQQLLTRDDPSYDAEGVRVVASTPAYDERGQAPRVTVGIPNYNYSVEIVQALRSVSVSEFTDFEIVVYDDVSSDNSIETISRFFETHPDLPAVLLQGRVNGGPSRSRNVIARRGRGELVYMLDADNAIYPRTLGVLVQALDDDPGAAFAYSTIASIGPAGPVGLLSAMAWDPTLFQRGNYIDMMALLRREALLDLGGFGEDTRLMGWEDYDLWCRFAEDGAYGVHVPEMLGRYRASSSGLLQFVNIDTPSVAEIIRGRSPSVFRLPGPEAAPARPPASAEGS